MPANARLSLTQRLGGWDNALELVAVARKDDVSQVRNELETAGYGLLHLRFSRAWSALRVRAQAPCRAGRAALRPRR